LNSLTLQLCYNTQNSVGGFLKTVFSIFLSVLFLYAEDQYIISYRGVVKETRLFNEQFNIAKAMMPKKYAATSELLTLPWQEGDNTVALIRQNQDLLTEELFKQGVLMNDALNTQVYSLETKTVITLPPTYITVTIKEDFATIRLIK
jgi:hypothetical protein